MITLFIAYIVCLVSNITLIVRRFQVKRRKYCWQCLCKERWKKTYLLYSCWVNFDVFSDRSWQGFLKTLNSRFQSWNHQGVLQIEEKHRHVKSCCLSAQYLCFYSTCNTLLVFVWIFFILRLSGSCSSDYYLLLVFIFGNLDPEHLLSPVQ